MKKSLPFALLLSLIVVPALAATQGEMLHDAEGGRLAPVQSVSADGSVEIIYHGKVVMIPAASLSTSADGELTTNLTKNQVIANR